MVEGRTFVGAAFFGSLIDVVNVRNTIKRTILYLQEKEVAVFRPLTPTTRH